MATPPALSFIDTPSSKRLIAHCCAATPFGAQMDRHIVSLERLLLQRCHYANEAREEMPGLATAGLKREEMGMSPLGCCPFLPVPINAFPDWSIWKDVIVPLRSYPRGDDLSWVRIIFLWRVLSICAAFTLGLNTFYRMHQGVKELRDLYLSWYPHDLMLKNKRCVYSDLWPKLSEHMGNMVSKDEQMLREFGLPVFDQ